MSEHVIIAVLHTALLGFFNDFTTSCITTTLSEKHKKYEKRNLNQQVSKGVYHINALEQAKSMRFLHNVSLQSFSHEQNCKNGRGVLVISVEKMEPNKPAKSLK